VRDAMIAVARINNHTPRGEGSGGWRRFMFRRGLSMIVVGRKVSPAGVVCVCVFIVFIWLDRFYLLRIPSLRMCIFPNMMDSFWQTNQESATHALR
jgi:hypothetical protein